MNGAFENKKASDVGGRKSLYHERRSKRNIIVGNVNGRSVGFGQGRDAFVAVPLLSVNGINGSGAPLILPIGQFIENGADDAKRRTVALKIVDAEEFGRDFRR